MKLKYKSEITWNLVRYDILKDITNLNDFKVILI